MSFLKQDPPNPTPAFRKRGPIRESVPIACASSSTSASVSSHKADAVDRRNPLCQKGVRRELGEFCAPDIRLEDPVARNPSRVDVDQRLTRAHAILGFLGTDQDSIGTFQVANRRAFCEKLRIRKHLKSQPLAVGLEDSRHRICRPYRQSRFLDHDLASVRTCEDFAGGSLPMLQISGAACALAECLGGSVD